MARPIPVEIHLRPGDAQCLVNLHGKRVQIVFMRIGPQIGQYVKDPVMAHRAPKLKALQFRRRIHTGMPDATASTLKKA